MKIKSIHLLCFFCVLIAMPNAVRAQGSAFTYQGRVTESGVGASGSNDFTFTLYTAAGGGATVGVSNVIEDLAITNGLFTVTLDFGASAFDGTARWLEIAVRPGASTGSYTKLAPRQAITATPHAMVAGKVTGSVAVSQLTGTIGSALLAPGSVTSNQLAAGSVNTSQLAEGAVSMSKLAADPTVALSLTVTNPTPLIYDQFGETLAALGTDRLIVGAPRDSTGAGSVGSVYLINSSGTLLTTFTNPTPANFDAFGSSVAILANTHILIGAQAGDAGVTNAGAAYLFTTNGALITTFTNPSPASTDAFGITVAGLGTDRVVIGATRDDTGASDAGSVYVFHTNGALVTTINNPNPATGLFGIALASLGTDKILIGSQSDSTAGLFAGAVFLYSTNGTRLATFTKPSPGISDWFGHSIAVVGTDKVLIGAPLDDTGSNNAGAAYLFSTNGTLLMTFPNPTPQASDEFGTSVAAVGTDRVLIGAEQDDTNGADSGAAYLFSTSGALLATIVNPTPAVADYFGGSMVALGPDRLAISARYDDVGAVDSGVVHLLRLETYVPGLISAGIVDGAITPADLDPSIGVWSKSGTNLFHSAGNIGIGTSTPSEKLHVAGNILATGTITGNGSGLTSLSAANLSSGTVPDARLSGNVARRDVANTFTGQIRLDTFDGFSQSSVGDFLIDAPFIAGGRMAVLTSGNVGLGTSTPQGKLHVYSPNNPTVVRVQSTGTPGFGRLEFVSNPQGDANEWRPGYIESTDNGGFTGGLSFNVNGTGAGNKFTSVEVMRIVNGRVGIGTNNPQSALQVVGTVTATAFNPPSDRNLKENFVPVSPREVLEKVAALPISRWNFKGDAATPHVGPMAQDFHAAFSLGTDERHIATVDADGVALAAIQGLNQIVQDRDARIAALEKSLAELKEVVANMAEKKRAENRPTR
jgi:hypothetical protein